jgi:hypothetical protein
VVGFYIDKKNRVLESFLPEDQTLVLSVLDKTTRSKVDTLQKIIWLEPNGQGEITQYKQARITFTDILPIKEVLRRVNIEKPKQVTFQKERYTYYIYMFIVPMTYPTTEKTNNREYFEAINAIQVEEMRKIDEKMKIIASERRQRASLIQKSPAQQPNTLLRRR